MMSKRHKKRRRVADSDTDDSNFSADRIEISPVPSLSSDSSIEAEGPPTSDSSLEIASRDEFVDLNKSDIVKGSEDFPTNAFHVDDDDSNLQASNQVGHEHNISALDISQDSIVQDNKGYRKITPIQKSSNSTPETTSDSNEENSSDGNSNNESESGLSSGICGNEDSDIDFSDDEVNVNIALDRPVYEGAPIGINDSMVAVLSYVLRHDCDGSEIVDLLELVNIHCKKEKNVLKTSLYFFKKYFSILKCPVIKHYYCSGCYYKLPGKDTKCPNAGQHPATTGTCIFVEMPLIPQLQAFFIKKKFYSNLNHRNTRSKLCEENLEDIYDGQLYKELQKAGFISEDKLENFTMTLNTDGVPVFKSSNKSLWPVFLNVNELPPNLRFKEEFTLIAGLWYGGKPNANLILEPILKTFQTIQKGFPVTLPSEKVVTARGIVLAATTDIPAKVMLCGMASYSGSFGCQVCKIKGETIKFVKKPTANKKKKKKKGANSKETNSKETNIKETESKAWVYKYTEDLPLRNLSETIKYGEEAQKILLKTGNPKTNVNGVKFPSAIFKIMYDGIRGYAVDDLHTLYLGVAKTLLNLHFDSAHSREPFSIRKHLKLVDERIVNVKLPNFLDREVRKIENDLAYFKGTELQTWILYLSIPLMDGILPEKYLEHHVDLVSSIYTLQSSSISPEALLSYDKILKNYVKNFEVLYGTRHMAMVFHLLLHLIYVVNNLGPMRRTSCFPYEHLNGVILKMVHGTRYIETQLASGCFLIKELPERLDTLSSIEVKEFCNKLLHPSLRLKKLEDIDCDSFSVGTYQPLSSKQNYALKILQDQGIRKEDTKFESFIRFKNDKKLFVSRSCPRTYQRNSYTCSFLSNQSTLGYGEIDFFVKVSSNTLPDQKFYAIIQLAVVEPYVIGCKEIPHILRYSLSTDYVAIPLDQLREMLVYVNVVDTGESFVCKPLQ